jgi:large repetitive protein
VITSLPFHNGEVGLAYGTVALGASGGTPPYQWIVSGGALASGISLTSDGHVSGTPSKAGQFGFTVEVADSVGGTASGPGSIAIATALALTQKCATTCKVEAGCTVCGLFGTANGGVTPYGYATVGGAVPSGMGLNGLQLTNAFTKVGPAGITIRVTDKLGATGLVVASWQVFAHIAFAVTNAVCGNSPSYCALQIKYSGGAPGGTPTVKVTSVTGAAISAPLPTGGCGTGVATTSPPPGMTTSATAGVMTLAAGPPNGTTWCYYVGTITFVLIDQSPCGPGTNCMTTNVLTVIFGL